MRFSLMDDSEKENNTHQIVDQILPINNMSNGQGLNLGIVNQYGQLMGDYSRLDDELWFGKNEDDESIKASNERFQCDFASADEKNVDPVPKLSNLVDNPVCDGGLTVAKECSSSIKDSSMDQSQTSSPSSVENRKSYNLRTTVKRTRSKRHRPSKYNSRKGFQSFGIISSATEQSHSFQSETFVQSPLLDEIAEPVVRTKKINDLLLSGSVEMKFKSNPKPIAKRKLSTKNAKKCQHCETMKTPQWREGPLGRATLCNACGVQYRHNRLFPEYRPRGSPTFDPALHSSLPKKVQQMRMGKTTDNCAISGNSGLPA